MKKPMGTTVVVTTDTRMNSDGKYEVVMSVVQKRTFNMSKWEERKTSIRIIGEDEYKAQVEAALVINAVLTKANGDLFNLSQKELLYDKTNHN
jgi:hypothetical protein